MSSINTYCPHCQLMNRLPVVQINSNARCVRCNMPLLQGKPIEGTTVNLKALINSELPMLVTFWAPYCDACLNFEPVFEALAGQQLEVCFVKVDIQAQPQLREQYHIRAIPTVMLFKQGEMVETLNDELPIDEWLTQALLK